MKQYSPKMKKKYVKNYYPQKPNTIFWFKMFV